MGRGVVLAIVLGGPALCFSQANGAIDPEKVAPQIVLSVHKHPTGADMVEVTAASPTYPQELLKAQCTRIGGLLGVPSRGVAVWESSNDPKFKFIKCSFATDGLFDPQSGTVRLEALVKPFLGAPAASEVRSFLVSVEGLKPVDKVTLQEYSSKSVVLKAKKTDYPEGIEYRIVALIQDPAKLDIPVRFQAQVEADGRPTEMASARPGWLIPALVSAASISGGVLVYLALSSRKRGAQAPASTRK